MPSPRAGGDSASPAIRVEAVPSSGLSTHSRFRGLTWDKKNGGWVWADRLCLLCLCHSAWGRPCGLRLQRPALLAVPDRRWRVRIAFCGKQRHVGTTLLWRFVGAVRHTRFGTSARAAGLSGQLTVHPAASSNCLNTPTCCDPAPSRFRWLRSPLPAARPPARPPALYSCPSPAGQAGRYPDDVTAAKAYDKAAVYLYGSAAVTNFGEAATGPKGGGVAREQRGRP